VGESIGVDVDVRKGCPYQVGGGAVGRRDGSRVLGMSRFVNGFVNRSVA
jgi:hypothetical protein